MMLPIGKVYIHYPIITYTIRKKKRLSVVLVSHGNYRHTNWCNNAIIFSALIIFSFEFIIKCIHPCTVSLAPFTYVYLISLSSIMLHAYYADYKTSTSSWKISPVLRNCCRSDYDCLILSPERSHKMLAKHQSRYIYQKLRIVPV